tara:strand:+ start:214 stop:663 length:450 start_codon:yes stop_codon:yes gene_type:complete
MIKRDDNGDMLDVPLHAAQNLAGIDQSRVSNGTLTQISDGLVSTHSLEPHSARLRLSARLDVDDCVLVIFKINHVLKDFTPSVSKVTTEDNVTDWLPRSAVLDEALTIRILITEGVAHSLILNLDGHEGVAERIIRDNFNILKHFVAPK